MTAQPRSSSSAEMLDWSSSSSLMHSTDSSQSLTSSHDRERAASAARAADGDDHQRPAVPPKPVGLVARRRESVERNTAMAITQQKEEVLPASRSRSPSSPIHPSQLQQRNPTALPPSPLASERRNSGKELHGPPPGSSPRRRAGSNAGVAPLLRQTSLKNSLSVSAEDKLAFQPLSQSARQIGKTASEERATSPHRGNTPPATIHPSPLSNSGSKPIAVRSSASEDDDVDQFVSHAVEALNITAVSAVPNNTSNELDDMLDFLEADTPRGPPVPAKPVVPQSSVTTVPLKTNQTPTQPLPPVPKSVVAGASVSAPSHVRSPSQFTATPPTAPIPSSSPSSPSPLRERSTSRDFTAASIMKKEHSSTQLDPNAPLTRTASQKVISQPLQPQPQPQPQSAPQSPPPNVAQPGGAISTLKRFAPSKLFGKSADRPGLTASDAGPYTAASTPPSSRALGFSDAASDTDSERSATSGAKEGSDKDVSTAPHSNDKKEMLKELKEGGAESISRGSRKRFSVFNLNPLTRARSGSFAPSATVHKESVASSPSEVTAAQWSQKEIVGEIKEAEPEVVVDEAYPPLIEAATGYTIEPLRKLLRPADLSLLEQDLHLAYYGPYLAPRPHVNLIGQSEEKDSAVISVEIVQNSNNDNLARVYARSRNGNERFVIPVCDTPKAAIKAILAAKPDFARYNLAPIENKELDDELVHIEKQQLPRSYKFGVLYCKAGQTKEAEIYANTEHSEAFEEFLNTLGERVTLEGFQGHRGGLDVQKNSTGKHSYYTTFRGYEIMFHVNTLLPYFPLDPQQLERKRHVGNDVGVIIFAEGTDPISIQSFNSELNHVFVVVHPEPVASPEGRTRYRMSFGLKEGVTPVNPYVPHPPVLERGSSFREWFLTKVINSERSALKAASFRDRLMKTRRGELQLLYDLYGPKTEKKTKRKSEKKKDKRLKDPASDKKDKVADEKKDKDKAALQAVAQAAAAEAERRAGEAKADGKKERKESDSSTRGKEVDHKREDESTTSQSEPGTPVSERAALGAADDSLEAK